MIFDNIINESYEPETTAIGRHPLTKAGGLMYIYENECNYNAIMRSVGLSELKYFKETGNDLFLCEAGARKSLWEKFIGFLKTVKEKIIQIFNKFVAYIRSKVGSDSSFISKYAKKLKLADVTNMTFVGYEKLFDAPDVNIISDDLVTNLDPVKYTQKIADEQEFINTNEEEARGKILGKTGGFTEAEFKDELEEMLAGDKIEMDVTSKMVSDAVDLIKDTTKTINKIEATKRKAVKVIDDAIKRFETWVKGVDYNAETLEFKNGKSKQTKDNVKNSIDYNKIQIPIMRTISNDLTYAFNAKVEAVKRANKQARQLCVKVLSYKPKNESAMIGSYNNIFDDITFA